MLDPQRLARLIVMVEEGRGLNLNLWEYLELLLEEDDNECEPVRAFQAMLDEALVEYRFKALTHNL